MNLSSAISQKRQKRFALLSLLLIVWAQAAFAGHNLQHELIASDTICDVCVQLDRIGDAVTSEQSASCVGGHHSQISFIESVSVSSTIRLPFLSRAPPKS